MEMYFVEMVSEYEENISLVLSYPSRVPIENVS
jgi:hypothetical protein